MPYPVITLKSWVSYLFQNHPRYVLGGFELSEKQKYTELFHTFWKRYQHVDQHHPVYRFFPESDFGRIVPFALHGDEGRGLSKVPLLVCGFQFVVPVQGVEKTNMAGYLGLFNATFFSRCYFTLILLALKLCMVQMLELLWKNPWGIHLAQGLHQPLFLLECTQNTMPPTTIFIKPWRKTAMNCFLKALQWTLSTGIALFFWEVIYFYLFSLVNLNIKFRHLILLPFQDSETFHFGFTGLKGDWPYLRKAAGLSTGFQCQRVCHLCENTVSLRKYRSYTFMWAMFFKWC